MFALRGFKRLFSLLPLLCAQHRCAGLLVAVVALPAIINSAASEISMGAAFEAAADDHRNLRAVKADRVTRQLRNSKGGRKTG